MPEAVIVDAIRTPIGRAFKGSLASLRPDETLAFVIDQVLERNPDVDPASVEEVDRRLRPAAGPAGQQHRPHRGAAERQARPGDQRARPSRATARPASTRSASPPTTSPRARATPTSPRGVEFVSRYNGAQEAAHPEDQHEQLQGRRRSARRVHRDGPHRRERRGAATASRASSRTSTPSARRSARSPRRRTASSIARSSR